MVFFMVNTFSAKLYSNTFFLCQKCHTKPFSLESTFSNIQVPCYCSTTLYASERVFFSFMVNPLHLHEPLHGSHGLSCNLSWRSKWSMKRGRKSCTFIFLNGYFLICNYGKECDVMRWSWWCFGGLWKSLMWFYPLFCFEETRIKPASFEAWVNPVVQWFLTLPTPVTLFLKILTGTAITNRSMRVETEHFWHSFWDLPELALGTLSSHWRTTAPAQLVGK